MLITDQTRYGKTNTLTQILENHCFIMIKYSFTLQINIKKKWLIFNRLWITDITKRRLVTMFLNWETQMIF